VTQNTTKERYPLHLDIIKHNTCPMTNAAIKPYPIVATTWVFNIQATIL